MYDLVTTSIAVSQDDLVLHSTNCAVMVVRTHMFIPKCTVVIAPIHGQVILKFEHQLHKKAPRENTIP